MDDIKIPCCDDLPELLDLDIALERMLAIKPLHMEPRSIPLADALGRILAEDIKSPLTLPAFDSSAVDGYAFRRKDCSGDRPQLKIAGESLAGKPFDKSLSPNIAIRIATGGVVPPDADTIIMQENCEIADGNITLLQMPPAGAYIRRLGTDVKTGDTVLTKGRRLMPQDIALVAGLGLTEMPVMPLLRVAIASTGTELRENGAQLEAGQIIDTNSLMLRHLFAHLPVEATIFPPLPDEQEATVIALREMAAMHDIVITTGGVSVGSHDFVRDALHMLGTIHFWRLAIRPGRPVILGQIGHCLMAGLPGNPVSAMVTFFLIVRPLLDQLWGGQPALTPGFLVPLAADIKKEPKLRSFPRARLQIHNGIWEAALYEDQSSNLLGSLVRTYGLLDLPAGATTFAKGTPVIFRPFAGLLD